MKTHADFSETDVTNGDAVGAWRTESPRHEYAPRFFTVTIGGEQLLGLAGRGLDAVNGRWVRAVPVVGGRHYAFSVQFLTQGIETPLRSVLVQLVWMNAAGKPMSPDEDGENLGHGEFPPTSAQADADGWFTISGVYQAPAQAVACRLALHLRWSAHGHVIWRKPELAETPPLPSRVVRLATVNHRPRGTGSVAENLDQFALCVEDAARQRADIVCLPEGITIVGTGKRLADVSEPIPGRTTAFLGALAARFHSYIVAGLYERDGDVLYNTAVLVGRDGGLVGRYRKACLPMEEIEGGLTPGHDCPVFDTDFGRVGLMVCWDVSYPQVAAQLAARGAEVLFLPIWGGSETLIRARAIENQVYLVASGYDAASAIYDRTGDPLAQAQHDPQVVVADVDLSARTRWFWIGDWRSRILRESPRLPAMP